MLGLTILEIAVLVVFSILMLIGIAFDRRSEEAFKWWVFFLGGGVLIWVLRPAEWSWSGAFEWATSSETITSIAVYFGLGLLYSCLEFGVGVRRIARKIEAHWQEFLDENINIDNKTRMSVREIMKSPTLAEEHAPTCVEKFIYSNKQNHRSSFIELERGHHRPVPKVDKGNLASHIGAWTFFWPFYALTLFFGDLLNMFFDWVSSAIANLSGRFVKMVFSDTFKI